MPRYWWFVFIFVILAVDIQAQILSTQALMPNPFGIVLTVGQWIYDATAKERIYYIEVEGIGLTNAQAQSNGFRLAVETALGTLITSEAEVQNGRLRRDEIISYAAGFVEKFEIIQTKSTPEGYAVIMKVWVRRSALADRLLGSSKTIGEVDGAGASVQLQTLNQERATGDALVISVLNDFPKRAFDIKLNQAEVVRSNRSPQIEIPFAISWSQDYLRSFWTALDATSQKTSKPDAIITINPGWGWMFKGYGGQAKFDDKNKYFLLVKKMVASRPAVLVTLRDNNRTVISSYCYRYQELDHDPQYHVTEERFVKLSPYNATAFLNGAYTMNSRISIPIQAQTLEQIAIVDMDVVLGDFCSK